jgi:geranylgeranylglycerol-phosphate geranylgeranyltransferase
MRSAYWHLVRGGNILVGTSTVYVGALMVRTDFSQVDCLLITLHALCVATFMAAWNAFNDVQDAAIDAINHPNRPIPSGQISEVRAKAVGRAMFLLSILFLLSAMWVAAMISDYLVSWLPSVAIWFIAFLLMFHYEMVIPESFMLKHKGLIGNMAVSILVGIVIVFGAAAIGGWKNPLAWLVGAVAMLVNAAREIIKDIEDEDGDSDRNTLTKKIGPEASRGMAQILILLSLLPLVAPYARGLLYPGLLITQMPAMMVLISVKPKLYRGEDHSAQRTLRVGMILGLLGFLASVIIPIQYSSLYA